MTFAPQVLCLAQHLSHEREVTQTNKGSDFASIRA
jgi:hypothetical protein